MVGGCIEPSSARVCIKNSCNSDSGTNKEQRVAARWFFALVIDVNSFLHIGHTGEVVRSLIGLRYPCADAMCDWRCA